MRHRILTCKNHPNFRWSCKDVAWTPESADKPGQYNGSRRLGFRGVPTGKGMYDDLSGMDCSIINNDGKIIVECDCGTDDLILAPEDALVKEPTNG